MDLKSKIILIAGPTASGKSNFALKLAKKVNGEIINADSMQVYKQLEVLTARPNKKDLKKIKHHLYGFFDVKKNFSTGEWLKLSISIVLGVISMIELFLLVRKRKVQTGNQAASALSRPGASVLSRKVMSGVTK